MKGWTTDVERRSSGGCSQSVRFMSDIYPALGQRGPACRVTQNHHRTPVPGEDRCLIGSPTGTKNCHQVGDFSARIGTSDKTTLNSETRWKKGVEALNEGWIASEEGRNSLDHARGVNRLGLEEFHDIKELVVNFVLILKANFDLVEVA